MDDTRMYSLRLRIHDRAHNFVTFVKHFLLDIFFIPHVTFKRTKTIHHWESGHCILYIQLCTFLVH